MQCAASDITSETKRAGFISDEGESCWLTRIRLNGEIVAVQVQTMHNIRACQLDRYDIARIDIQLSRLVGKFVCFDPNKVGLWS